MTEQISIKARSLLFLLCALCGAGAVPVILRYLLKSSESGGLGLDIWVINAIRYSMAPLFWFPFVLWKNVQQRTEKDTSSVINGLNRRCIWKASIVPACFSIINQTAWGAVGKYADANSIAFVSKLSFPVAVLFSFILFPNERLLARNRLFWLGIFFCLFGMIVLSYKSLLSVGGNSTSYVGMLLLLLIAVSWGGYSVSVRQYMSCYSAVSSFWVVSAYTSVGLLFFMFLFGDCAMVRELDRTTWQIIIASSFIGIVFWHVLYYKAIRGIGTVVADGVLMSSPFLTVAGSAVFLGEEISLLQAVGGCVLAGGSILLVIARGRSMKKSNK